MNQSVSESETLHNNNTVHDLLCILKLKKFDMVLAKSCVDQAWNVSSDNEGVGACRKQYV